MSIQRAAASVLTGAAIGWGSFAAVSGSAHLTAVAVVALAIAVGLDRDRSLR